ncbi:MAG: prephenate dehydrogenase [Actinobacteria bacterium]|nr:prephenate dehydrogenase [Actinomycetota bacterium]
MLVRIVGSGLIGTSIGLASRGQGFDVEMVDSEPARSRLAQDLVGGHRTGPADIVVLALPSSKLSLVLSDEIALNPKAVFMDIGSTKTNPQREVEKFGEFKTQFCGTHPMAGRESGGPESARADLFEGRPWILCPSQATSPSTVDVVERFVRSLGSIAMTMSGSDHDAAVALVSHLPQIVASLLAAQLSGSPEERLALAGQGLRDTTRIAHSDPRLWREIISMNKAEILPLLVSLQGQLGNLIENFDDADAIEEAMRKGKAGVEAIPGKHGGRARNYFYLSVVIDDKPGQLAALFNECAKAEVNVEDLTIEHSPGQFTGLISLALSEIDAEKLSEHLALNGWKVHSPRSD